MLFRSDSKIAAAERLRSAPRFKVGERIRHRVFGVGSVREVDEGRRAYLVKFDDMGTMRTITFRVPLERVE